MLPAMLRPILHPTLRKPLPALRAARARHRVARPPRRPGPCRAPASARRRPASRPAEGPHGRCTRPPRPAVRRRRRVRGPPARRGGGGGTRRSAGAASASAERPAGRAAGRALGGARHPFGLARLGPVARPPAGAAAAAGPLAGDGDPDWLTGLRAEDVIQPSECSAQQRARAGALVHARVGEAPQRVGWPGRPRVTASPAHSATPALLQEVDGSSGTTEYPVHRAPTGATQPPRWVLVRVWVGVGVGVGANARA